MGLAPSAFWQLSFVSNPWAPLAQKAQLHPVLNTERMGTCTDWEQRSNTYLQAIHNNPEQKALSNFTLPTFETSYINRVFAGKRLALIGDSTMRILVNGLNAVLNVTNPQFLGSLQNIPLATARNAFISETIRTQSALGLHLRTKNPNASFHGGDVLQYNTPTDTDVVSAQKHHTQLMYAGFRGDDFLYNHVWYEHAFAKFRSFQPDILVANFGLHLFHHNQFIRGEHLVRMWLNYEEWLQKVVNQAEQMKVKLLLFKTTNFICEERYPPLLREATLMNKTTYVSICRGWFDRVIKDPPHGGKVIYNFTDEQIDRYCWEASGRDANARLLNQRMWDFVAKVKQRQAAASVDATSSLRIEVYNDHDMQTCEYTKVGNGSHFEDMLIPRVRLLAHLIDCLWKD